jgi:hypothetical protein
VKARVRCRSCGAAREISDPRHLVALACSGCGKTAEVRASEDFASALEDALAQLWHLAATFEIDVELSSRDIPPAFTPEGYKVSS